MKVVLIIQARMTSTRLPGKVMKEVLGIPLLEYQIRRLKRSKLVNKIIVATTINKTDQPIIDLCDRLSISTYRGSEDNVLSRYYESAVENKANIVVRITSDCPLIDPLIVDQIVDCYIRNRDKYDYVSNTIKRTFPRGMDVEVFSFFALEKAYKEATKEYEKEHVTPHIYKNTNKFKVLGYECDEDHSIHRWTVDTSQDFELVKKIIESLYPDNPEFGIMNILDLFKSQPELLSINSHVKQKN